MKKSFGLALTDELQEMLEREYQQGGVHELTVLRS
jgi:hypothetical protein